MRERIKWIDVLKGCCLLFIAFSHYVTAPEYVRLLTHPTAMYWVPMFIMLSGLLYNDKKEIPFAQYARKKTRTLLIPYVAFTFIFIVLDWNTYLQDGSLVRNLHKAFVEGSGPEKASPLWFLPVLYFTTLAGYWLQKLWKRPHVVGLLLLALTGVALCLSMYEIKLPWLLHLLPSAMVYYVSGTIIFKMSQYVKGACTRKCCLSLLILTFGGGISGFWLDLGDFHLNVIHNYVMFYLSPISFTFSLTLFCSLWKYSYTDFVSKAMMWIGKNGMVVLACHAYLIIIINNVVSHFGMDGTSWMVFVLKTAFIFLTLYFIVVPIFNKYLWFLIGKTKSTRI